MGGTLMFYNKKQDMDGIEISSTSDIACLLKRVREENHLTIADVSNHIKIRSEHLSFIENDLFQKLPGKVYAIGFVRTYANYLGLDENFIVEKMRILPEFTDALVIIKAPKIERSSKGISFSVMLLASVLLLLFFTMFSYFSDSKKTVHISSSLHTEHQTPSQEEKKDVTFQ